MPLDYGDRPLNQQHVVNNYNEEHHFINYGSDRASFRKDTATNTNSYTLVENNRNSRTWYFYSNTWWDVSSPCKLHFRTFIFDRYHTLPGGRPSVASTALHPGHVTVNDSDFQSLPPGQAWVVFPKDSVHSSNNFTARPLNLASSIGSRLKQSFSNINRGTPPQSVTPVQAFFNTSDQAQLVGYTVKAQISGKIGRLTFVR